MASVIATIGDVVVVSHVVLLFAMILHMLPFRFRDARGANNDTSGGVSSGSSS